MLVLICTALALIGTTIVIHGVGTNQWLHYLIRHYTGGSGQFKPRARLSILISTAVVLITLHLIEILLWALAYRWVAPDELPTLESAVYFSSVTFTSLGYGDITLSSKWRLLSGLEAIDGILLIGWTTAFLFAILQRSWGPLGNSENKD